MEEKLEKERKKYSEARERKNWLIYQLLVSNNLRECKRIIEEQLKETDGLCEYALYVSGN